MNSIIYLDNAATSWPKPAVVGEAVADAIANRGGNPGRSGHRLSLEAGGILDNARFLLAKLFGVADADRIIFCANATDALNLGLLGLLADGDHAVTSSMEHNSVTRPLTALAARGVSVTKVAMDPVSGVRPEDIKNAIRPDTKLVVLTHASNVTGTVNPVKEIGDICRNAGVTFLLDASQTAGVLPIDVESVGVGLLAFPGHKGLMGPTGTGGLYIAEGVNLKPLRFGGTGVYSELRTQPEELPYKYEAGTQNAHGIAGLAASVKFILDTGAEEIALRESKLSELLLSELGRIDGVIIYGEAASGAKRAPVVSINIAGADCAEVAVILDTAFGIAVRAGLHCAPDAHRTLGTYELGGTIRISPGRFNTEEDILRCADAIREIAAEYGN
jgi:cysteine desulfurase family protein